MYVSVRHSLILPWTYTYKLIKRPHSLGTSGIKVKIKSVLKNFWSLVLNFTAPRYTLLFLYSKIYIVHVLNCEWSRSVNFSLRMFCMWYKHFFLALVDTIALEIILLFLIFVDDVVSPLYFFFFSLFSYLVHFMFPIPLIWQVRYDYHSLGL